MSESQDLRKIERKAFLTIYQDGLYDICFGIFLLAWAVIPVLKEIGINKYLAIPPFLVIPAIILFAGKKYISLPRFGSAMFGPQRLAKATRLVGAGAITLLISYLLLLVVSVIGIEAATESGPAGYEIVIAESLAIFIIVSALAYFTDFRRLYLYAVFFAGGIPLAETLYHYVGVPFDALLAFGVPALGVLVTGLVLLFKFLRRYPPPSTETVNRV